MKVSTKGLLTACVALAMAGCTMSEKPITDAELGFKSDGCDLAKLKVDPMFKGVKFTDDPAGVSLEGINAEVMLGAYAKKNHCKVYALSMEEMIKGLLKDSAMTGAGDMGKEQAGKFILIAGKVAKCAKVLEMKLPIKTLG